MTEAFDRRPFFQARRDLRDLITVPVMAWVGFTPARKTVPAYRDLIDAPMELAAAGFSVTTTTNGEGWRIVVEKEITEGADLYLEGVARSYASALFQIASTVDQALSDLEIEARKAWERAQEGVAA